MIEIHDLSGPQLALPAEAQQVVMEFLAKQDDWSEKDRETVADIFKEVRER